MNTTINVQLPTIAKLVEPDGYSNIAFDVALEHRHAFANWLRQLADDIDAVSPLNRELEALRAVHAALELVEGSSRERIIEWARARFGK